MQQKTRARAQREFAALAARAVVT
ncbi:hypothetical protein Cabther_A2264 [Chloracidobacterium thermophilum B]|uniref:Uncharacterized protein n=1 Tax=Chloracidobacterium thermophilum (strain B) TaxID=981222 RepID=G2LF71_CHLTF|nr:hypothetical protein Cabther_A2264 [Chloracidobacterium thermophilum B]